MKFKIEYRKEKIKPGNWIGMNYPASIKLNVPFKHKHKNVIEIWKTSKPVMKVTEKHEEIESSLMKQGMKYHQAHKIALVHEQDNIRVSKILKQLRRKI